MHRSLKISFIFSLFLLFLSPFIFAQRTYQCDDPDRNDPDCLNPDSKRNTCGYYTEDCPFEVCGKDVLNGCKACDDDEVLYYETKSCDPAIMISRCKDYSGTSCSESSTLAAYDPYCGFTKGNQGEVVRTTFWNLCLLCNSNDFYAYKRGPCEEDRVYCNVPDPSQSTDSTGPVCASFTSENSRFVYINVSSGAEACKSGTFEFWTQGECGGLKDEKTYCNPDIQEENCPTESNPACGFYKENGGSPAHSVVDNACASCAWGDISYYTPGPCTFTCEAEIVDKSSPCFWTFKPVCATYELRGETKTVSLQSPCAACSQYGFPISSFTEGVCPGGGILCSDYNGADFSAILNPVCAYFTPDCNDNSCRKTYSEPLIACNDPKTIWYGPGICPGDPGIPCDNFRTIPTEGPRVSAYVCGLAFKECFEKVCVDDYDSPYTACETVNVDYFVPGYCKDRP